MEVRPTFSGARKFYSRAAETGTLGSSPTDPVTCPITFVRTIWHHFPLTLLILQLAWSSFVQVLTEWLPTSPTSPSRSPGIAVPTSAIFTAGFSLFILLAFFIREATTRQRDAVESLHTISHSLRHIMRKLRLGYPRGTWHSGDHDRIFGHLAAYPIALKMSLRHERHPDQLAPLLHPSDVRDILAAPSMHLHCAKIVRAYFACAEDDSPYNFPPIAASSTPAGMGTRLHIITLIDTVDRASASLTRIETLLPAAGYVSHLRAFVYIWAFILPSALVADSEWLTPLWATLITYPIAALFNVSYKLSRPLDRASMAVPLTHLCAQISVDVLTDAEKGALSYSELVHELPDFTASEWLSAPLPSSARGYAPYSLPSHSSLRMIRTIALPLAAFLFWSAAVVFMTWGLSQQRDPPRDDGDRWWSAQVPIPVSASSNISAAVFLLLSFWTTDAYARYTRSVRIWTDVVRPNIELVANVFSQLTPASFWHAHDHERAFAHLAALPTTMRLHLRNSRDLSSLQSLLSPSDVGAFENDPRPFPIRCMDVLLAYIDSADAADKSVLAPDTQAPYQTTAYTLQVALWEADRSLWECVAIRSTPIAPPVTLHLQLFAALWLLLLPMTIVQTDGFVSFVYLVPIAFSTMTLIRVGVRLADPFGCANEDLPLHVFCEEIRDSIHRIFLDTRKGTRGRIHTGESYNRSLFEPRRAKECMGDLSHNNRSMHRIWHRLPRFSIARWRRFLGMGQNSPLVSSDLPSVHTEKYTPTLANTIGRYVSRFPTISFRAYVAVTLWSVLSVVVSWLLSELWEGQDRGECRKWCSPIDVQGYVLSNVGFALFLILSFRTADSVERFDEGARTLYDLQEQLRGLAVDFTLTFPTGFFHPGDKERVVAHIVQIPLVLREMLLTNSNGRGAVSKGLLTDSDRMRLEESSSPIEHLLESIQSYVLLQDSRIRDGWDELGEFRAPPGLTAPLIGRIFRIRQIVARTTTIKRFPVVASYRLHETIFTLIWLAMLPLSMTRDTGFFAVLWSTLISYGVLALRDVAAQLSDPFGCDVHDLPLTDLCTDAVQLVLEGVFSSGWDTDRVSIERSALDEVKTVVGAGLSDHEVVVTFALPQVYMDGALDEGWRSFDTRSRLRPQRTVFTHVLFSTPWREVTLTFIWSAIASTISAWTRSSGGNDADDWWRSTIAITTDVIDGASFGAFTLLGLFTTAAFIRHQRAGALWEEDLRRNCHALAATAMAFYRDDAVHIGDKERIVGLIAAMPLLIKAELSNSRDVREVSALLNLEDLAFSSRSNSMVLHCCDRVRAYMIRLITAPDKLLNLDEAAPPRIRSGFIRTPLVNIESAFHEARFLKTFGVSPILKVLLRVLLGMWFILLPFILFQVSGWLALLWTPLVAFGIVGIYAVAVELQEPFGTDLNDIDTDTISRSIVEDVLHVHRHQKFAYQRPILEDPTPTTWSEELSKTPDTQPRAADARSRTWWSCTKEFLRLLLIAVPAWEFVVLALWSGLILGIGFAISARFDVENCNSRWFCSFMAVDDRIKEYIGFALFMLLGFRISDNHARFVQAQRLWHEGIIGTAGILSNRLLQSFAPGSFHEGDLARICGFIVAIPIVLAASLRHGTIDSQAIGKLQQVLGKSDIDNIVGAVEPVSYCTDVLRAYLFYVERLEVISPERNGISIEEYAPCIAYLETLHNTSLECLRMVRLALPFGYSTHLRIFLGIWLFILPVGLVELTGWLLVLWTLLIGYGVLGIQRWADKLFDPFSCDESDLPLNAFVDAAIDAVKTNMRLFPVGAYSMLRNAAEKAAFPDVSSTLLTTATCYRS